MPAHSNAQPLVLDQSNEYIDALNEVFNNARVKSEFDYICALLRIRGLDSPGWDELDESFALFKDLTTLVQAPLEPITKIRLLLLLYSHMIDADAVYWTIQNMLSTAQGQGCLASPFESMLNGNGGGSQPPSAKSMVNKIIQSAKALKLTGFTEIMTQMFDEDVRKAFDHSTYRLAEDEFSTKEGMFPEELYFSGSEPKFEKHRIQAKSMSLGELVALINRGLTFFQAFNYVRVSHARSYTAEKVIDTKFGPATLLIHAEYGLIGFEVRNIESGA